MFYGSFNSSQLLLEARSSESVNFTWLPIIAVNRKPFRKYNLKICKLERDQCPNDQDMRYQYDHLNVNFTYLKPSSCYYVFFSLGMSHWNYNQKFCTKASLPVTYILYCSNYKISVLNEDELSISLSITTSGNFSTEEKVSEEEYSYILILGVFDKDKNITEISNGPFTVDLKLCYKNPGLFFINYHRKVLQPNNLYAIERFDATSNSTEITLDKSKFNETLYNYYLWIGCTASLDGVIDVIFSDYYNIFAEKMFASADIGASTFIDNHYTALFIILPIAFIGLIILIFFLVKWRKDAKFVQSLLNSNENNQLPSTSMSLFDLLYNRKNFKILEDEFHFIQKNFHQAKSVVGLLPENVSKNRYKDYLPFDFNRVVLPPACSNCSDYINASYVPTTYHFNKFITTQCPLPNTVEDFWTMVWVNKVYMLILLADINEISFFKYWPENSKKELNYNSMNVKLLSTVQTSATSHQQVFKVRKNDVQFVLMVEQWSYLSWTPELLPGNLNSFASFVTTLKLIFKTNKGPVAVICNDGSQKCGLLLTLVEAANQLTKCSTVDILKIVNRLRSQRVHMIEHLVHYCTVYEILYETLKLNCHK